MSTDLRHVDIPLLRPRLAAHHRVEDLSPDLGADLRVRPGTDDIEEGIFLIRSQIGAITGCVNYVNESKTVCTYR